MNRYLIILLGFVLVNLKAFSQAPVDNPCAPTYLPAGAEWPLDGVCYPFDLPTSFTSLYNPGSCNSDARDDGWAWFVGDGNSVTVTYNPDSRDAIVHVLAISTGCTISLTGCADDFGNGGSESVTFLSTLGTIYLVRIQRYNSSSGMTGDLCISSAPVVSGNGDDCANAIRINCGDPVLAGESTIGNGDTEDNWSCTPVAWGANATPGEDRFYVVNWPDGASGGSIRFAFSNVSDVNDLYFEFYYLGTACTPNTCSYHAQYDIVAGTVNGSSLSYIDVSVPAGVQDHYFVIDSQNDGVDTYDLEVTCYATGIELDQTNSCGGSSEPCNYKLDMFDSYGDGWNGGNIDMYVNGTNIGPYSASGYSTSATFPVSSGNSLRLDYNSGSYETENSFIFRDGRNVILHFEVPSPNTGTLYNTTAASGGCAFDASNPNSGVYCTWQELDGLGIPIGAESLAPATQDPALGGKYKICENIYLKNPNGFEWLKDAVVTVGECWTNVTDITPNGSNTGFYNVDGDWTASWNSGTRQISYTFANSKNATWGDGNNGSAGYTCNLYQFCYVADVDPTCSPVVGFQDGLYVEDDGIGGGGGSTGAANVDISSTGSTTNVLPVELIDFTAQLQEGKPAFVSIDWSTFSEINNDYFIIERSTDGINYLPINKIDGQGNSTKLHRYQSEDLNPVVGDNYYRLKQVDYNGRATTYNPQLVELSESLTFVLLPNPSNGNFSIEGESIEKVEITDVYGKLVYNSNFHQLNKVQLSLKLKPAVYFLKVTQNGKDEVHKLIIE
ncbi:MAG: T9SS type A sorting domain-containing protein [Bacteroidales bacterium]|nr:T9SS type A sorting domain-containing protein [Bacteroidales bacterium]